MNPEEIIKRQEEEFNKRFGVDKTTDYWKGFANEILHWHSSSIKEILEVVKRGVEDIERFGYRETSDKRELDFIEKPEVINLLESIINKLK